MTTLYGIPNCDTVKKARRWLKDQGIEHDFHDYKKLGIDVKKLQAWASQSDWELLLNRRGTTWRKLDAATRDSVTASSALTLMAEHTSLIKRPVVEDDGKLLVGFNEADWQQHFSTRPA